MPTAKADLILHPVRMRVILALAGPGAGHLSAADMADMDKDDHMQVFTAFAVTLLGDFARYLNSRAEVRPAVDGVGFHKYPLYLSDTEFGEFAKQLSDLLLPYLSHDPTPERRRRLLSLIVLPDDDLP